MYYNESLVSTNYFFPRQKGFYRGKVRDVYSINDKFMIMIACDRISAFDHVLPRPIPYKGQILNQIAAYFLEATRDVCPNWLISTPDPNVSVGYRCKTYPVEMVIRGYLVGHAWREYAKGNRNICGIDLPEGLSENDPLPNPIITPTIKATKGHDTDVSRNEIIGTGLVSESDYEILEKYTFGLYKRGCEMADTQNLILVDTKYEFGNYNGEIMLIDEVHTPDSSRYFYKDEYNHRHITGIKPEQVSKEFVRQWLIERGFQGLEGQKIPEMNSEFIESVTSKYIELYKKITGLDFVQPGYDNVLGRIEENINIWLTANSIH